MKISKIFLAVFLSLIALFLLFPFLLKQQHIKDSTTRYINTTLGINSQVGDIYWRWFPSPALEIENVSTNSSTYSLTIPKLLLYPNLKSLIEPELSLGMVKLLNPHLQVKSSPSPAKLPDQIKLPNIKIRISGGKLSLPAEYVNIADYSSKFYALQDLDGIVITEQSRLQFKFKGSSNFSNHFNTTGKLDLLSGYFQLAFEGKGTNLQKLVNTPPQSFWKPESTNLDVNINYEGIGTKEGRLTLQSPRFAFPVNLLETTISTYSLKKLNISWNNEKLIAQIDALGISDPPFQLSGKISKVFKNQETSAKWDIDLSAEDINISQARKHLFKLSKKHLYALDIYKIVKGGFSDNLQFSFKGSFADFHDLKAIKIWGNARNVPIYIEDIDLSIDQVTGSFSIIDGILNSKGFSADIDKSHGENGTILLDLKKHGDAFTFEMDMDVDLENLQDTLGQIIEDDTFIEELERFTHISGRTHGNLHLGESLNDVLTRIEINGLQAEGIYDRLPWPFTINNAGSKITPDDISWNNVNVQLGNQHITHSDGTVDWRKNVTLNVSKFDAFLDLSTFFNEGFLQTNTKILSVKHYFSDIFDEISGVANLSKCSIQGPVLEPENWEFTSFINTSNVIVKNNSLPQNIESKVVQAKLTHDTAAFTGAFNFLDQNLFVSGNYRHRLLDKFIGKTEFNGVISKKIGQWLKEQDWLNIQYFPRLPFRLKQFQIITNQQSLDHYQASGSIVSNKPDGSKVILEVEANRQNDFEMSSLNFIDGNQQGKITYNVWKSHSQKTMLTWQGVLESSTIDSFFDKSFITSGRLQGVFSRLTSQSYPMETTFSGYVEAYDLSWLQDNNDTPILIRALKANGAGETIKINHLNLEVGEEQLNIRGIAETVDENYKVNLDIDSQELTINKMFDAFNSVAEKINMHRNVQKKNKPDPSFFTSNDKNAKRLIPESITGTINFDVDQFHYIRTFPEKSPDTDDSSSQNEAVNELVNTNEKPSIHTYSWSPFTGSLSTEDDIDLKLIVSNSAICDIAMSGSLYYGSNAENSYFKFDESDSIAHFETTLPCLGIEHSLIDGPFSIEGSLTGLPEKWRSGSLTLTSHEGIIRRMNLLANIFTVVNFTDIFTFDDVPDFNKKGLIYNDLFVTSSIEDNILELGKATLKGKGVNLTGRGIVDLATHHTDLTFFIAPFKMIDTVVTSVPLVGKALGGKKESILTFPVAVSGPLANPDVTALEPAAIGTAALELIIDTLTLPVRIFINDDVEKLPKKSIPPQ